jgi:GT2 family glycosyltransferase
MPVLSIVVVNWNTRQLLAQCLRSVQLETLISHEIWVVDNGSTDGSVEMLRAEFPGVQVIANQENRGFAAANNQALARCQGQYLLLLNSDTIVLSGALDRMVAAMHAHPTIGALGCRLLNVDGSLQASAHTFYNSWRSLIENRLMARLWPFRHSRTPFLTFWDHSHPRSVDWVSGAALLIRREVLKTVGPLDEQFFMYGEEIDWQMRIKKAGYQVWFNPNASIIHLGGGSAKQAKQAMNRIELQSRDALIRKHYPPRTQSFYRFKRSLASRLQG